MTFDWTADRVEGLRKFAADGKPASQIATELGGGLTRNAIVGKAFRIGLTLRGVNKRPNNPQGRNGRPKPKRSPQARVWPQGIAPPTERAEAPKPIPPAPNSRPVGIMGLTNTTCRWPLWDVDVRAIEERLFCGALEADNTNGQPYCPFHTAAGINRRGGA